MFQVFHCTFFPHSICSIHKLSPFIWYNIFSFSVFNFFHIVQIQSTLSSVRTHIHYANFVLMAVLYPRHSSRASKDYSIAFNGFVTFSADVWACYCSTEFRCCDGGAQQGSCSTLQTTLLFMGTIIRAMSTTCQNCVAGRWSNNGLSSLRRLVPTNNRQLYVELARLWDSTWKKRDHSHNSSTRGRNACSG